MGKSDAARRPSIASAVLLAALTCAGLVACSFDYGGAAGDRPEVPSARFTNYSHNVVTRGALSFQLNAKSAEVYGSGKRTELVGVTFSEFDPDNGQLLSSGSAERATFWNESQDAEFSGSVKLDSRKEDAVLVGEYLKWDAKAKKLVGRLDRTVTISRSDGSVVSGAGFQADSRRRSFSFGDSVEGVIVQKQGDTK